MECRESHRRLRLLLVAPILVAALWPGRLAAEPLWRKVIPGRRVAADPKADYWLTDEDGPWLIVAATFSGDGAEDQARELVLELRRRYKLEAYLHAMSFDFSQGVHGRGVDRYGAPLRMRYQRNQAIRELAVLVGNYPQVDDPEAQGTLNRIKTLRPQAVDLNHRHTTSQSLAALRTIQNALLPDGDARKKLGPMSRAFVTRNPLLPHEDPVPSAVDDAIVKMNEGVPHCLLDCPGKYTVQVATFTGTVVLDQQKIARYQTHKQLPSRLAQAADRAHRLTLALRDKGYDAFEFHDRHASLVTVGAFQSVGVPRADGKTEINPQIHTILKTFGAAPLPDQAGGGSAGFTPKTLAGIPFDLQPQIVHVPRRAVRRVSFAE
ncbi:MAG: hypothetical protein A2W31_18310 [Planctomycetes bacterium RBG_16_64_10]|nr:MAG: hypothetical protein A2W31_18310 [Planctomycetes bacterium RBG_16_64_10]